MPYDEALADRIRGVLKGKRGVSEKKMFGGLSFLMRGHMVCGVIGADLMVRVGPAAYDEALARRHVREMDFTGRPLKGMVYVEAAGIRSRRQLESWVAKGIDFARGLPAR